MFRAEKKSAGIAFHQGGNSAHEHEMEESRTDYSFQEGRRKNDTGFLMAVDENIVRTRQARQKKLLVKKVI